MTLTCSILTWLAYVPTGPSPRFDLVSLYGLGPIAASVARTDPVTGEKINRLRKSYEGKIKGMGLSGRNKPVKHEPGTPGGLRQLTLWPEEEWQNQKVFGKEIKVAEPGSALYNLHMRVMKLEPGRVPNNEYWEDVLGHEKPPKHVPAIAQSKKAGDPVAGVARQFNQANGTPVSTPLSGADSGRPKRAGKKRSYNDSSFVGYGEGFPDDELELDGSFYSNSEEGSRSSVKKKRKKVASRLTILSKGHLTYSLWFELTQVTTGSYLDGSAFFNRTERQLRRRNVRSWRTMKLR